MRNKCRFRPAVASILEITIAIVILGVLAALAIPKLSRADTAGPGPELRERLTLLRTAIELYHEDHGVYPCQRDDVASSSAPVEDRAGDQAAISAQLLRQLTPYLRDGVPRSPLRLRSGPATIHITTGAVSDAIATVDADWIYDVDTGYLFANSPRVDDEGVRFDRY